MKKILIIRFSSLGDIVLTSPLIRTLRKKFPAAQIDFLTRTEYSELLKYNPHISDVIEFNVEAGFSGLRKLKRQLGFTQYDIILDIQRNLRSLYLCLGLKGRIHGRPQIFKVNKHPFIRLLLIYCKINLYPKPPNPILKVWEKYLLTAKSLGIFYDGLGFDIFLPEIPEQIIAKIVPPIQDREKYVVIAPGAKHYTKRWPPEYYAEFIKLYLSRYNHRLVLVGGRGDLETEKQILDLLDEGMVLSCIAKLSISQTAVLIKGAALFVGNDSGLTHVAAAFGIPSITIFGSTVEAFGFFPDNPRGVVVEVENLSCRPCTPIGRKSCPKKHLKCLKKIEAKTVLNLITEKNFLN
jgi:heptosyltransferase-2